MKTKVIAILTTFFVVGVTLFFFMSKPGFVKVSSFKILGLENNVLKANAILKVKNDNWFSVKGQTLKVRLLYKNRNIAQAFSSKFNLKKRSTSNLNLNFDFYLDSIEPDMKYILLQDSFLVNTKMEGLFSFLKIKGVKEHQIWLRSEKIIDPLIKSAMSKKGAQLKSMKVKELGLDKSKFDIEIEFKNKLPIEFEIIKVVCFISPEKESLLDVANAKFFVNKKINPNQIEIIKGEVEVNNFQSFFVGIKKVFQRKTDAYLNGKIYIALSGHKFVIPIQQHFEVNLLTQEVIILNDENE